MFNVTCTICSLPYEAATKTRKYCSDACKWQGRPKVPCVECGGPTGWSTSSKRKNPTCNECRTSKHGVVARYKSGCRCDECRAANNAYSREWQKRARARGWEPATRKAKRLSCEWCGKIVKSRTGASDGIVLCKPHRDEKIARDARKISRRRRFELVIARAARGSRSSRIWVQGPCLVCREPFMSAGKESRYCSRECRAFARTRSNWISFEDRISIYERDRWLCMICGDPVSGEYDMHDPLSPTLDHIVPRSRGGSDDPENLRLAHLICNSVRGDLSYTHEGGDSLV